MDQRSVDYEPLQILDQMMFDQYLNRSPESVASLDHWRCSVSSDYANARSCLRQARMEIARCLLDARRYPQWRGPQSLEYMRYGMEVFTAVSFIRYLDYGLEEFASDSQAAQLLEQVIACEGNLSLEPREAIRGPRFQCLLSGMRYGEV